MDRRFGFLWGIAIACSSPAPPRAAHVALPQPSHAAAPAQLAIPEDVAGAYAAGWTWWAAGKRDDALRAFRYAVATLLVKGDPNPRRRSREPLKSVREDADTSAHEGDRTLTLTDTGVLLGDARKHAFERFIEIPSAYQTQLAGGGLAAVSGGDEIALVDLTHGAIVARARMQGATLIRGKSRFLVYGASDGFVVEVWDAASRTRVQTLRDPSLAYASFVNFADDERAVVAGGEHDDVWDVASAERILTYQGPPAVPSVPAFSSDGRFIAYGTVDFDKTPTVGTTYLFDRRAKKVVATSHASHFPTGFAFDGKWLVVGDLRMACLLEAPSMRRVACSQQVRPHYGIDDDLQETTPTFVASGSAVALQTGDGSMLVARVPSMTTIWKGRLRFEDGELVDSDGNGSVWAFGSDGVPVAAAPLPSEASSNVSIPSCRVGTWIFPAAACTFTK